MRHAFQREAVRHDAAAVDGGRHRRGLDPRSGRDLGEELLLAGMRRRGGTPRSASRVAAEQQHRRVLPRAVVLDRPVGSGPHSRSSSVAFAFARGSAPARAGRAGGVGRGRDRDLRVVQIRSRPDERQRLERFRGTAEEGEERRIPRLTRRPPRPRPRRRARDGAPRRRRRARPRRGSAPRRSLRDDLGRRPEGTRRVSFDSQEGVSHVPTKDTITAARARGGCCGSHGDRIAGGCSIGSTRLREPHEHDLPGAADLRDARRRSWPPAGIAGIADRRTAAPGPPVPTGIRTASTTSRACSRTPATTSRSTRSTSSTTRTRCWSSSRPCRRPTTRGRSWERNRRRHGQRHSRRRQPRAAQSQHERLRGG